MSTPTLARDVRHTRIRLSGPAVGETYPIKNVSNVLLCIDKLLESAFFVLADSKGLPDRWSRLQIKVVSRFPEKGSIVFPIEIQLAAAAAATQISPQQIFDLGKKALELFLKLGEVFKKDNGKPGSQITVEGNNNTITIVSGNSRVTETRQVFETVERSYIELNRLPGQLTEDAVNRMELEERPGEKLEISAASRAKLQAFPKPIRDEVTRLLKEQQTTARGSKAVLLEAPYLAEEMEGSGDIVSFDKSDKTGTIELSRASGIPPGRYKFRLRSTETMSSAIVAMLQSRVRIRFKAETIRRKILLNITWIEKELSAGA